MTRRRPYAISKAQRRAEAAEYTAHYSDDGAGAFVLIDETSDAKPTACDLCHKPCTTDDYCTGCKTIVCEACDRPVAERPSGPHKREDHLPRAKVLS